MWQVGTICAFRLCVLHRNGPIGRLLGGAADGRFAFCFPRFSVRDLPCRLLSRYKQERPAERDILRVSGRASPCMAATTGAAAAHRAASFTPHAISSSANAACTHGPQAGNVAQPWRPYRIYLALLDRTYYARPPLTSHPGCATCGMCGVRPGPAPTTGHRRYAYDSPPPEA